MAEEPTVINMVTCPYCATEWVREDTELVCSQCIPSLNVDLALADLINSVNKLEDEEPSEIGSRMELIVSTHQKLTALIKRARPKT